MPRRGGPGRLAGAAVAAALAFASVGCGTTLQTGAAPADTSEAQSLGGPPLAAAPSPTPIGPGAAPGLLSPATNPAIAPATAGRGNATEPPGGPNSVSSSSTGTTGPVSGYGFDARHIYIGIGTTGDASSYAKSLGINANVGDSQAQAQAVITDINRHGGLAGRQIVPVWFDVNTVSYNLNPQGTAQSECATFTQDHHVFAAVNTISYPNNGIACLAKAHTIALTSTPAGPVESADLERFSPYFYAPGMADSGHLIGPFIAELKREGYFNAWNTASSKPGTAPVRVGLIYAADRSDVLDLTKSALARYGLTVAQSFYLSSSADISQLVSAALRLKAEGVTHVLTFGFLSIFPELAAIQGYYPRYGVSTWDGLQTAKSSEAARDFVGALGVGWAPFEDGTSAFHNAAEAHCLTIMRNAGQQTTDRTTDAVMAAMCDQFSFLRAALDGVRVPSPTVVAQHLDSLGAGFHSAATYGESFGPNRHAGVSAFRPIAFETSCSCFEYTGSAVSFP